MRLSESQVQPIQTTAKAKNGTRSSPKAGRGLYDSNMSAASRLPLMPENAPRPLKHVEKVEPG